jgi:hypothetical protein
MRRLLIASAVALVLVGFSAPASAAPPSNDPAVAAKFAGQWLATKVNSQGFIPQAADPTTANLSTSAQAVLALAAVHVATEQVHAIVAYLGAHVDEFVTHGGQSADDDPGALAYLIMDAVVDHQDPTSFGTSTTDLVARLQATKQPNGLFGASDPSFDGAFRQGLALMALKAVGTTDSAAADWLVGQQCADGSWTSFRADTSTPCPAVDPNTFTGPDTNSTAIAVLGLQAQGRTAPAATGANALLAVRNSGGGWGFLARADQPTDANSTGLVVSALISATGSKDQQGTAALLALQAGCDADPPEDGGGISFQDLSSGPDALATAQATPALAGVVLPLGPSSAGPDELVSCPAGASPTPSTDNATTTAPTVTGEPLARTGTWSGREVGGAVVLVVLGFVLVQQAQVRRRRHG